MNNNGIAFVSGDKKRAITFKDIAKALGSPKGLPIPKDMEMGFEATVNFRPPDVTYCNGTHVAEVKVDVETGVVEIVRYQVVNDSGIVSIYSATFVEFIRHTLGFTVLNSIILLLFRYFSNNV